MSKYEPNRAVHRRTSIWAFWAAILLFTLVSPAKAYVGPGAGFAFISSLLTLFISFLLAIFSLLVLPVRLLFSFLRSGAGFANARVKRVIILGFDGMDPELCDHYMQQRLLPNLARLKGDGSFLPLQTTCPSLSPVAWSSFATGVNPAKHRIFDFLHRHPTTYLPELSSYRVHGTRKRIVLGDRQIPLGVPKIELTRKSRSFWHILGEHAVFSQIIRVPITFPPEKFNGHLLSSMCTPDLLGSQGSFTFYTSEKNRAVSYTNGVCMPLEKDDRGYKGQFVGPQDIFRTTPRPLALDFHLTLQEGDSMHLQVNGVKHRLQKEKLTPWIPLTFRSGWAKIHGICQMLLKATVPHVQLYVSPLHIDPERPAMPISHPPTYSTYLAKLLGPFATLGLAEDSWALNEGVLDERAFLDQVYQYHRERERQFFHVLKKNRRGLCACVFDATDRIQHTFFHYLDKDHPGHKDGEERSKNAIRDVYRKADEVVGRVLQTMQKGTLLLVMSDHGFKSFRRGININTWLWQNGYLALKTTSERSDYLQNVDWAKTKAYAIGLAGIYINRVGRENHGIVAEADAAALKKKIIAELSGLIDPQEKKTAIRTVYDFAEVNKGPYASEAPDLIVGYNPGYRISWDGAIGKTTAALFEDNTKAWSGDHGIDPEQAPGVLFSNYRITDAHASIMDIAPTVLALFGIAKPSYMDGQELHFADL